MVHTSAWSTAAECLLLLLLLLPTPAVAGTAAAVAAAAPIRWIDNARHVAAAVAHNGVYVTT